MFVYGTLKRGQCRAHLWPKKPLQIEIAHALGRLYDLGPYPALVEGDARVRGEVWRFAQADMPETLRVLDEVEAAANTEHQLYARRVLDCWLAEGEVQRAYAYFLSDFSLVRSRSPMAAGSDGSCGWPA